MKASRKRIKKIIVQALLVTMATGYVNFASVKVSGEVKEDSRLAEDSDNDGLNNGLEEVFGSDPTKADTDEDGLDDFIEVKLGLSPSNRDSNGNGILDINEDYDGDGLSNIEEMNLKTDPTKKDTDADGLVDGEEVNTYFTSPVAMDSDGDGLFDGDEIKLGLNPNKESSDNVTKDSERKFYQVLSNDRISSVALEDECKFKPSLSGNVKGVLDRNVAMDSYDTAPLQDIKGVIGEAVSITSEYTDEELNLSFDYTNYLNSNEKVDINKLAICNFDNNDFTILDTINDEAKKCLTAKVNKTGVYFIINKDEASHNRKGSNELSNLKANKFFRGAAVEAKDSDYDGIDDMSDSKPNNNTFSGELKTSFANSKVSYVMDYRNFFAGNKKYNKNISTISSLFSSVIYGGSTYSGMNINQFMSYHGIKDIKEYNLANMYNDADLTDAYVGHRKVTYNGETKEIIVVVVKGTGGAKEWESNFDIGSTANKSKYPDWKITANHKGFDVASTRILRCIDEYEKSSFLDKSVKKTYWVTGHSRGAGIANILGARLVDSSKDVYCYTFAAPNSTTASNAENTDTYAGIYNIINKDDMVPCLPVPAWGFKNYGKSYTVSIAKNYEKEWEELTSKVDYDSDTIGFDTTINEIGKIMKNRNDAYILTCKCHGDNSNNKITITNRGMSKDSREGAIKKIPTNALPYCKITRYNGTGIVGWDFKVCQEPEYFMQLLASFLAGQINAYRFAVELNIAGRYESAKAAIIRSGIGGLAHPHYPESYYLLSKHI